MTTVQSWEPLVKAFESSDHGQHLAAMLKEAGERVGADNIYPPDPYRALRLTSLDDVKVVILGQDPYHGQGQANGLAFSVAADVKMPPSLKNIFKEIERSLGTPIPKNGDLTRWAKQGVLLLNAVLTVEKASPASHSKFGWQILTDALIKAVAQREQPTVYMLWGRFAQEKKTLIEQYGGAKLILESNHPSPFSALRPPIPFIGNDHFKKANAWLQQQGMEPIRW